MASRGDAPVIELSNEFATINIRKVSTRNGERLEIAAPRLGYRILLDALALESLTWQTMDTFSRFLQTPFGPVDGPGHGS
ncbi:MAG: dihydrodiol dehydrogenase [Armatimonadota bacterium]|nr:dihydrodiol dehydrogenase [Armatimonadota bacterium]MDR7549346.1 dihydrodiol dehydrogenase [Armatimonadota bacterium]